MTTGGGDQRLGEYFWVSTVQSLADDLPTPRLEFYCDGVRAFVLQAEDGENGIVFVLTDYDDSQPFVYPSDGSARAEPQSRRGLDLILDDDTAAVGTEVFATECAGTRAGVESAIARVAQWVMNEQDRWSGLDAIVTKTSMTFDTCAHVIDRRYDSVHLTLADTPHRLSRKSETTEMYESVGHAALTTLRTIAYYFEQRKLATCRESNK
jgi:hypothetical protein